MMNIMGAMDVNIAGLGRLKYMPAPKSVEAYFKILKGIEPVHHWNKDDNLLARELYQEAIILDYEFLGWTYHHEVVNGWTEDYIGSLQKAKELGEKAVTLGDPLGHNLLMRVYLLQGQIDKALTEGEEGLAISPNLAEINVLFGETLSIAGRHEEAIERVKKGIRLNPHHPSFYFMLMGACYFGAGMIEKAIEFYERDVQQNPNAMSRSWITLAGLYSQLGRDEEAKKAAKEVHRIVPDYSWEKYGKAFIFKDKEIERKFFDGLRKVGLK